MCVVLPRKNFNQTVATATHNPAAILTPDNGANAFTSHYSVARYLLRARPLLKTPETERGVVASTDKFAPIRAERHARYGCGMSKHVVGALAYEVFISVLDW
jgi:hypothetical protein